VSYLTFQTHCRNAQVVANQWQTEFGRCVVNRICTLCLHQLMERMTSAEPIGQKWFGEKIRLIYYWPRQMDILLSSLPLQTSNHR